MKLIPQRDALWLPGACPPERGHVAYYWLGGTGWVPGPCYCQVREEKP